MAHPPTPPSLAGLAPRTILVRGTNWIGDTVMTLPALAAIRQTFPQARIVFLVKPWVEDLARLCPDVDEIFRYEARTRHRGIGGIATLAADLRRRGFDMAILLQNAFEAAFLAFLARIPVRAGYATDGRQWLLTHPVRRTRQVRAIHQTGYYLHLAAQLGCKAGATAPRLAVPADWTARARGFLAGHGLPPDGLCIGLAPGAAYGPAKRWLPERFAAVADRLARTFAAQTLLFGSREDRAVTEQVRQAMETPAVNLAGATDLRDAIALIAVCGLFLANDSGLMHVAGALDVPLVALFGSTDPRATAPAGSRSRVLHAAVPCSPCLKTHCPTDFRCMTAIDADTVFRAARDLLAAGGHAPVCREAGDAP